MTPAELAAIRARADAATPGEWKMDWDTRPYHRDGMPWCTFAIGPRHGVPADPSASAAAKAISNDAAKARNADATFIAHARQDVLRLCAEVDRLTAEVERLRSDYEHGHAAGDAARMQRCKQDVARIASAVADELERRAAHPLWVSPADHAKVTK